MGLERVDIEIEDVHHCAVLLVGDRSTIENIDVLDAKRGGDML